VDVCPSAKPVLIYAALQTVAMGALGPTFERQVFTVEYGAGIGSDRSQVTALAC